MLTGENISAVHGITVMSSKLAITSQEEDLKIFVYKDENTPILGIQSALVPQKKVKIELEKIQRRIQNGLYTNKTDRLKVLCLEKSKER